MTTASGDPACAVIAFGSDKTVSSGTFTIQFPTADATNAIIQDSIRRVLLMCLDLSESGTTSIWGGTE